MIAVGLLQYSGTDSQRSFVVSHEVRDCSLPLNVFSLKSIKITS